MTSRRQGARRHARRALPQPAAGGHGGTIGKIPHWALILRAGRWGETPGQAPATPAAGGPVQREDRAAVRVAPLGEDQAAAAGCPHDLAAPVHGGILTSAAVAARVLAPSLLLLAVAMSGGYGIGPPAAAPVTLTVRPRAQAGRAWRNEPRPLATCVTGGASRTGTSSVHRIASLVPFHARIWV
jgi:hypothetical protein